MVFRKTARTRKTNKWIQEIADPIQLITYQILLYVKVLIVALIIYIFALTVSDFSFTIENLGDVAKGGTSWQVDSNPKRNI